VLAVLVASTAASAQSNGAGSPILHEFIKIETGAGAGGRPFVPGERGPTDLPKGISYNGEFLPQPSAAPDPGAEPDFVPDDETMKPDERTEREGVLPYQEIFNPAIAPHKRSRAFDAVLPDDTLGIADRALSPIPVVGNQSDPERDLFFGSLELSLVANAPQPIPSVSAESRILSYKASPAVDLRFFKDSADNYYVSAGKTVAVKLTFLTDAPKSYFGGAIPEEAKLSDVPAGLRPKLSASLTQRAREVMRKARVPKDSARFSEVLTPLVAYFRDFQAGDFTPRPDGDRYLGLALSQLGVCRHRAYAFVVTAQAAGIPARYLFNEAHAWVEVFVPSVGWQRIDLGGEADGLNVSGGRGKPLYKPSVEDPFEQPDRPSNNANGPGNNGGNDGGEGDNNGDNNGGEFKVSGFDRVSGLRSSDSGGGTGGGVTEGPEAEGPSEGPEPSEENPAPSNNAGASEPAPAPAMNVGSVPVVLALHEAPSSTLRGDTIVVRGRADGPEGPAARLRVEIRLTRPEGALLLGATVTDASGDFSAELRVPPDLERLGHYNVSLSTPGDANYAPTPR
jgi:transglutaminase-like putative cysteine protease